MHIEQMAVIIRLKFIKMSLTRGKALPENCFTGRESPVKHPRSGVDSDPTATSL